MKCYLCGTELIWGGDHDCEEESEDYSIVTNLSCPNCQAFVLVYHPKDDGEWEEA
jgi:DNA-directed RNA polymerase subunit RPC12/RpoP